VTVAEKRGGVVLHELPDGTHALTNPDLGTMLVINEVGAAVWLLLDGCETVEDLIASMRDALPEAPPSLVSDVDAFLAQLAQHAMTR
jgi:hypothetical protein